MLPNSDGLLKNVFAKFDEYDYSTPSYLILSYTTYVILKDMASLSFVEDVAQLRQVLERNNISNEDVGENVLITLLEQHASDEQHIDLVLLDLQDLLGKELVVGQLGKTQQERKELHQSGDKQPSDSRCSSANTATKSYQPADNPSCHSRCFLLDQLQELLNPSAEHGITTVGSIHSVSDYEYQQQDFELVNEEVSSDAVVSAYQIPEYGMAVSLPNKWVRKVPELEDNHAQRINESFIAARLHRADCNLQPSDCNCTNVSWIAALPQVVTSVHRGKWDVVLRNKNVNRIWEKTKTLLTENKLGNGAEVTRVSKGFLLMCLYTYDFEDVRDVFRVLVSIRRNCLSSSYLLYQTAAQSAGFCSAEKKHPGEKVSMYSSPPPTDKDFVQLFLHNIEPDYKKGLVAEMRKDFGSVDLEEIFYNPPQLVPQPAAV